MQRFDLTGRAWQRYLGGISADGVEFSRDGQWVAYISYPERSMWRCRSDGTQCLELAAGRTGAYQPHWSPDGKTIAFDSVTRDLQQPYIAFPSLYRQWRIWLVNADGSNLRLAAPSYAGIQTDPSWTADGKRIIFAESDYARAASSLRILDLESGRVTKMPGGDGLYSPKSSPDRSRLVALTSEGQSSIVIFDPATGQRRIASGEWAGFPNWTADNKSIVYVGASGIRRFRLDTWKAETIVAIDRLTDIVANFGWPWVGLDHDGNPLVMRNRDVRQVYEVEFASK